MIQTCQLDLVLGVLLVVGLIYGLRRGLVRSIFLVAGGFLGVIAAAFTVPLISLWVPTAEWRTPATLAASALLVLAGITLGSSIGVVLRRRLDRTPLRKIDRLLGGMLSSIATALVLGTAGAGITAIGSPVLSQSIASSVVLSTINDLTPRPLRSWIADLRFSAVASELPALAEALNGRTPVIPRLDTDSPQLAKAARSVVKITGNAYACGQNQTGSGFVVAPDRIITNAHVVAGVQRPLVESAVDGARTGEVVYFDPVGDVAIIAVRKLATIPLALAPALAEGSPAIINGFPLGGPFSSHPASIVSIGALRVPDIHGKNPTPRTVYTLAANVQQGESGGPLLDRSGRVAGMVFAKGATSPDVGFAIAAADISAVISTASARRAEVSSGECTTG